MKIEKHIGLAVYLYYNRDSRKLAKYGQVIYHSKRFRYVMLYVKEEQLESLIVTLDKQQFVKSVVPSQLSAIDNDFVGSLKRLDEKGY